MMDGEFEEGDDSIAGRVWVDVTILWCPEQHVLPVLEDAQRRARSGGERGGGVEGGESPPGTHSAAGTHDSGGEARGAGDAGASSDFVDPAAATAAGLQDHGGAPGVRSYLGARESGGVLALFFASAVRMSAWLVIPRTLLLLLWTLGNVVSWGLLGRQPTGVRTPPQQQPPEEPVAASLSPPGSSPHLSASASASASSSVSSSSSTRADYTLLLQGRSLSRRRRRRSSGYYGNPLVFLWRSIVSLSDGSARSSSPTPSSFSVTRLLSSAYYSIFRPVAPEASEVDLVLWSWLRLRSPHVQANYIALCRRLRRLARAFSAGRDEPSHTYRLSIGAEALGWDGALADFHLFDEDNDGYHSPGGYATGAAASAAPATSSSPPSSSMPSARRGGHGGRHENGKERWLAGPPPPLVLLTWRPVSWVTRYSVVSAALVVIVVLYTALFREGGGVIHA